MLDRSRWRDPQSRRGALLRTALYVPLYIAVEYLLFLAFFGIVGNRLKGSGEFLASGATLLAALIAGGALITALDQRRLGALGFAWTKRTLAELGIGTALGGLGIVTAVALMLAFGALTYVHEAGTTLMWLRVVLGHLAVFAIAAAAEEAVFRGYGFQALVRGFGPVLATIGSSAAFAFAHAGNPNVTRLALLNIFLAGLLLGFAYLRTMSLWFATAVHLGWNWTMASLFDLPVSGITMFQTPLYEPVTRGAPWLGGGTFGPEGGIAGTIGMAAALLVLAWWKGIRVAPEMAALQPLALDTTTTMTATEHREHTHE